MLMALAILIPVSVFSAMALNMLLEAERRAAYRSMHETARGIVGALDREFSMAEASLRTLATSPYLVSQDLEILHTQARRLSKDPLSWTILYDKDGKQRFNTALAPDSAMPLSPSKARIEQALQKRQTLISDLGVGTAVRRLVVAMDVPVVEPGLPPYVLTRVFDPAYFNRIFNKLSDRPQWLMGVFDKDGRTVARSREPRKDLIGKYPSDSLLKGILSGETRVFRNRSRDGVELYTALTKSSQSGWTVAVGVPVAEVENAAQRAVLLVSAGLLAALLCAIGFAAFLSRRVISAIAHAHESAASLGQGQVPRPHDTRIHEVDRLLLAQAQAGAMLTKERQRRLRVEVEREALLQREIQAREAAEAQNKAKDLFLAMLGHELRNPLAAITGAATLLRIGATVPGRLERTLDILERQSEHLTHIVNDLLDVARVTSGKIVLQREPVEFGALVQRCVDAIQSAGRTLCRFDVHVEVVWIEADPTRMEQVVNNLLTNAVKFTGDDGCIEVRVHRSGNDVILSVSDNGSGIDPELLPRIFDLFSQGAVSLDRSKGGLGIGLTLVKQLVEMHHGHVSAHSAGPGQGATFTVRLPLHDDTVDHDSATTIVVAPMRRLRVLLIEDNADARMVMRDLLLAQGHDVLEAEEGRAGIRLALEALPDVSIVDIGLPGMNGLEVAQQLRCHDATRHLYLIALSGYGQAEDKSRSKQAGFNLHLVKPVKADEIFRVLAGLASSDRPPS